jgi:hypothetical protein
MIAFYSFLSAYEALIYIFLILVGIFLGRWLWRTWKAWRGAIYGLEKEVSQRRFARALGANVIWVALFLGEFVIASFIVPSIPASMFIPTPTVDLLTTPTGTISPELASTLDARPTPQSEDFSEGCVPGQSIIDSPVPGQNLSGIVDLIGTVNVPDFGFYKFEIAPAGQETWAPLYAGREIIQDDILGRIDTSGLTPGDYRLRLVVTNNIGEAMEPCEVLIRVVGAE